MTWFAVDVGILDDLALQEVADKFGAEAISAWIVLLCQAKLRAKGDVVPIPYRRLAIDAHLPSPERADEVLRGFARVGLVRYEEATKLGAVVTIVNWQKHQRDLMGAARSARYRAKKAAEHHEAVTPASRSPRDANVTERDLQDRTGQGQGQKTNTNEGEHAEIVDRFKLIATRRTGKALKVDVPALLRALDDFAHLPELRQHSFDCAEWLGSGKGLQREDAARVLRSWLKRDAEKLPAERRERRGSNRFVQNAA